MQHQTPHLPLLSHTPHFPLIFHQHELELGSFELVKDLKPINIHWPLNYNTTKLIEK